MPRKSDELWIQPAVLAGIFAKGGEGHYRVTAGPDPEAKIKHVAMEWRDGDWWVVIYYDRDVDEPQLVALHAK